MGRRVHRSILAAAVGVLALTAPVMSAEQAKTVVRFVNWSAGGLWEQVTRRIIADFEKLNPDIKVEYMPVPWGGEQNYLERITTWVLGDSAPDVIQLSYAILPQLAEQGVLQPVDALINGDTSEVNPTDILPLAREATSWKGKTYGLPFDLSLWWVNYNRDAFAGAGLMDPVALYEQNGWTWEAMELAARKITRRGPDNKVEGWGILTFPGDAGLYPWLWAFGGDLLDRDGTRPRIGETQSVNGIAYMHRLMYENGIMTFPTWTGIPIGADLDAALTKGAFGMQLWWNTVVGGYRNMKVQWRFDQVPMPPGPVSPNTIPTHIHTLAIMKSTKQLEAAWRLVKYLGGREGYAPVVRELGWGPLRRSLLPLWASTLSQMGVQGLKYFDEGIARTRLRPRHVRMIEIEREVQRSLQPVWRNEAPVKSTLEQLAQKIEVILTSK